jgi:hypothetical protein
MNNKSRNKAKNFLSVVDISRKQRKQFVIALHIELPYPSSRSRFLFEKAVVAHVGIKPRAPYGTQRIITVNITVFCGVCRIFW